MIVYLDPTETRKGTRLPAALADRGTVLAGLEERTGADLLLSPLNRPAASDTLLRQHCQAGVLVQRKTGQDLVSSITDGRLTRSLMKMREWGPLAWLVVVGTIERQGEKAVVDGRSGLSYNAVIGALDWYQMRGGFVTVLDSDDSLSRWVGQWEGRFTKLESGAVTVSTQPAQQSMLPDDRSRLLASIPGIGPDRARSLLSQAGSIASALVWLTNGTARQVDGIGPKSEESARAWLGLGDDTELDLEPKDTRMRVVNALLSAQDASGIPNWSLMFAAACENAGMECSHPGGWKEWLRAGLEKDGQE